ncbi:MAG: hypothetical protein RRY03_04965 [Oscillospiraceae bacterium]
MRIAIFTETYFPFISGVVTHIETLKNCLEAKGHEVLIVTTNPKAVCHYVKDGVLYCPAIPLSAYMGTALQTHLIYKGYGLLKILIRTFYMFTLNLAWGFSACLPRAS